MQAWTPHTGRPVAQGEGRNARWWRAWMCVVRYDEIAADQVDLLFQAKLLEQRFHLGIHARRLAPGRHPIGHAILSVGELWATLLSMSVWQTGDVVSNGIRTHYLRSGGHKPPLVLLHGATDSSRCWTPIAEALTDDYDVVLPDARGHGLSDAPPSGYSSAERAADTARLIQALGLAKVAVGGHSMGGQTTCRLAADHPELVACAILEDPPFRPAQSAEARLSSVRQSMREEVAHLKGLSPESGLEYGRQRHPNWPDAELPAWVESKVQLSD